LVIARGGEVMIIGGGQLYRQAMPLASRMILTLVECEPRADTWFPEWDGADWQLLGSRTVGADENNPLAYCVQEFVREL
jgi:dihydrofolate reductase